MWGGLTGFTWNDVEWVMWGELTGFMWSDAKCGDVGWTDVIYVE
jgi:hypothetical protein